VLLLLCIGVDHVNLRRTRRLRDLLLNCNLFLTNCCI
jgi:hypothetical protein